MNSHLLIVSTKSYTGCVVQKIYEKWLEKYFHRIEDKVVKKNLEIFEQGKSKAFVEIEPFSVPIFIVYGWGMAAAVLIIEIIWNRLKKQFLK